MATDSAVKNWTDVVSTSAPPRVKVPKLNTDVESPEDETVTLTDSLASYDALSVYFSFAFHLAALGIALLVLWLLDMLYLQAFVPVDPIRAALADETILNEEPLMEIQPLEVEPPAAQEVPEDSAVSIAKAISEESLQSAQVLDMVTGSKGTDGAQGLNVWLPKGANAVTKGSFTAWTTPEHPAEGQPYSIVIEVKLPQRVKIYRLTDLSGKVVGSDNYTQRLPWDSVRGTWPSMMKDDRVYRVGRNERIRVKDNKIQTIIRVPGAQRLVRDQISVRSELLKEEQAIELRFGDPNRPG